MGAALVLVFIHFVADFLCQTDKMALNKSKSLYWLSMHVLTYTAVLWGGSIFLFYGYSDLFAVVSAYAGVNGGLHFITDFFTSKLTSKLWQRESKHWFFVAIGFDQAIHYSCLFLSYGYLIKFPFDR
ncbi:MAG: DUF3307 domain-containing protein [Bacteroidota bacterium]